jgi:hypothetical protein
VRKPRDKAKVEVAQGIERWILAPLRHCTFFSLAELNAALAAQLERYNDRELSREAGTRRSRYEELDRPVLKPLPAQRYQYATWKKAKVHLDYHIGGGAAVLLGALPPDRQDRGSAPHRAHGRGVLSWPGGRHAPSAGRAAPLRHRPGAPPRAAPSRDRAQPRALLERAEATGPATAAVLREQVHRRAHPDEALRPSLGILRLAHDFSTAALEQACAQAVELRTYSYRATTTHN